MSAARRERRAAERARLKEAKTAPLEFVDTTVLGEMWTRGPIAFFVPGIPDGAHPELANAIERRRNATFSGRCGCGARLRLVEGVAHFEHAAGCQVTDAAINELVRRHGWTAA